MVVQQLPILFSPTFAQQHLWCDVVRCSYQRMSQAALMLPVGALLQCHQTVATATVRHVVPEVTGLHTVLSDVAPWKQKKGNNFVKHSILPRLAGDLKVLYEI